MRTKLTLSIENSVIAKAKSLAERRGKSVSQLFSGFIEQNDRIEEKLDALKNTSGIINANLAAEGEHSYGDHLLKKHGHK